MRCSEPADRRGDFAGGGGGGGSFVKRPITVVWSRPAYDCVTSADDDDVVW